MKTWIVCVMLMLSGCQARRYQHMWVLKEVPHKIELCSINFMTFNENKNMAIKLPDNATLGLDSSLSYLDPNAIKILTAAGLLLP